MNKCLNCGTQLNAVIITDGEWIDFSYKCPKCRKGKSIAQHDSKAIEKLKDTYSHLQNSFWR